MPNRSQHFVCEDWVACEVVFFNIDDYAHKNALNLAKNKWHTAWKKRNIFELD